MCSERLWLRAFTRGRVGAVAIVHLCCEGDHDAVRPVLDALSERWAVFKHAEDEAGAHGWYTVEIVGEPTKDSAIEKVASCRAGGRSRTRRRHGRRYLQAPDLVRGSPGPGRGGATGR